MANHCALCMGSHDGDCPPPRKPTNPLRAALVQTLEAMKGVLPIVDCDCPDHPDDDFVGWQGSENIPVTFGQVRNFMKAITAAEAVLKDNQNGA